MQSIKYQLASMSLKRPSIIFRLKFHVSSINRKLIVATTSTKFQRCSRPIKVIQKITTSREFHQCPALFVRKSRFGKQDNDDDDDVYGEDVETSPSLAYTVRREMQQKFHKEFKASRARKDTQEEDLEILSVDPEALYKEIRRMDAALLLEMLESQHEKLEPVHFPVALRRLNQLRRQQKEEQRDDFIESVNEDQGFQILCAYLAKLGADYEYDIIADMLVFMCNFHLDSDHLAVKVFLELSKSIVSDLKLDQIVQIADAVSQLTPTPSSRLLMAAMTALVPSRPAELSLIDSAKQRVALLTLFGTSLKPAMRDQLLSLLNQDGIPTSKCVQVLQALANLHSLGSSDALIELEKQCLEVAHSEYTHLSWEDTLQVMVLCNQRGYYIPDFNAMVAKDAENGTLNDMIDVLKMCREQSYVHKGLLNKAAEAIMKKTEIDEKDSALSNEDILELLHCMSDGHMELDQPQSAAAHIGNLIAESPTENSDDLVVASVHLSVLGCQLPTNLEKQLFSLDINSLNREESMEKGAKKFQTADLLQMMYVQHSKENRANNTGEREKLVLQGDITKALGGEEYVQHGFVTSNGLKIDHFVCLDENGKLVTKNEHERDDLKKVGVLVLPKECFNRNTGQLRGESFMYAKTLQQQGINVAVVNLLAYDRMDERNRLEYLAHKVSHHHLYQDLVMIGADNAQN